MQLTPVIGLIAIVVSLRAVASCAEGCDGGDGRAMGGASVGFGVRLWIDSERKPR